VPAGVCRTALGLKLCVAMNKAPYNLSEFQFHPDAQDHCSVTVAYEDTDARQRALSLCHHLVRSFWAEIDFEFSWWRFRYLQDPEIAQAAAQTASQANVLVFSTSSTQYPSKEVTGWIDLWTPQRKSGEGVLLILTPDTDETLLDSTPLFAFLQTVARRAGMDILPRFAQEPWPPVTANSRLIENRARETSRILNEILRKSGTPPTLPSHWGINE
jgi:hypothetical protein